jgi:hypothetical protein
MQKLPRLNHNQIELKKTRHSDIIDYHSYVKFKPCNTTVSISAIEQMSNDCVLDDEIKKKHLYYHDQEVYGRFRKEMQEVMFNFLYTINRYDDGESWKTTIDIPRAELYSLEGKLKSIISGI